MSQFPSTLPVGITLITAVSGKRFFTMIETEHGLSLDTFGFGSSKEESVASATARYWNELFDKRGLNTASHIKGTVCVYLDGETKAKRVPAGELEDYLAKGFKQGMPSARGARKVVTEVQATA